MADLTGLQPDAPIFDELRARYREPQRHYHTLEHVGELLGLLDELRAYGRRVELVAWAIWFHDAVYDPTRPDNEAKSAELALQRLPELGLAPADVAAVERMVRATAGHRWGDGEPDTALFLDLDLSILGARPERYDVYVAQVRAEYAFVPEPVFTTKREVLLRAWLGRESLYFTEVGRSRFEAAARANIERELRGDRADP